jgi:acetyl esterase
MAYNFDPEFQDIIPLLPVGSFADPVAARTLMLDVVRAMNAGVDFSALRIDDRSIPGWAGEPQVTVRVYTPAKREAGVPGLLYIHGGGFTVGDLDTEHGLAGEFSRELGIVVVSVDYRLAPEHPYPAGLNDCYAALSWMHANAARLGIDPARIGICGQSAGGGLAAALALLARDRRGPAICFQVLGIPELDDRLATPSMHCFTDTPLWNRPSAELSWQMYLGDIAPGSANVPVYAAPARATDLTGLPPAYVTAMEFDPLRDEDILYALALLQAGVPVELHTYPGTFHGCGIVPHAAVSRRYSEDVQGALRRGLRIQEQA